MRAQQVSHTGDCVGASSTRAHETHVGAKTVAISASAIEAIKLKNLKNLKNPKNPNGHSIPYRFRFSHNAFRLIPRIAAARL